MFNAYRTYRKAKQEANGSAIVKVGDLYIVGPFKTCSEIAIINGAGIYEGCVCISHLKRLGNANWASKGNLGTTPTDLINNE